MTWKNTKFTKLFFFGGGGGVSGGYAQIKHHLQVKTVQNSSKQLCQRMWEDKVNGLFLWRKHYYRLRTGILARSDSLKLKRLNDVSYKHAAFHFTRHKLMDWSCVDYCNVLYSCLDSHSDGTHSLQRIHWSASDEKLNLFRCRNKLINILDGLRVRIFLGNLFL